MLGKKMQLENFIPTQFSLHFLDKIFWWSRKKTPKPYHLFFFPPTQPNALQKSFLSYFLSKVLHTPYFTSKQIHPNSLETFLELRKK